MTRPNNEIARMADVAMYEAEEDLDHPKVTLLNMTDNPLRNMAAAAEMYRGHRVQDIRHISRTSALKWLEDMQRTGTKAPMEFVQMHFLFEGVTRGFTHQLVRQRTAVYVQESTRFAVKRNAVVALPPSLARLPEDNPQRVVWDEAVKAMAVAYTRLVSSGIPAEDARGLLPTNVTTKVHYHTNLRALMDHAGMRLCSQAQYEWKQVWLLMLEAITSYPRTNGSTNVTMADQWQYDAIARLFKPVCYNTGKCEFMAATDRHCNIRNRVQEHYRNGEGPEHWLDIDPREALVEGAARKAQ